MNISVLYRVAVCPEVALAYHPLDGADGPSILKPLEFDLEFYFFPQVELVHDSSKCC